MIEWLWWFLIRGYMEWPFVLQFSSSPLDFVSSLFLGACFGEVDFDDLEANLIFAVLFLWRSISVTLRQIYFLQCSTL